MVEPTLPQGFLQYFSGDRCQKVFVTIQANQISFLPDDPSKAPGTLQPLAVFDLSKTQVIESGDLKRPKSFGLSTPQGLVELACPTNSVRAAWVKAFSEATSTVPPSSSFRKIPLPESVGAFRTPMPAGSQLKSPTDSTFRPAMMSSIPTPYAPNVQAEPARGGYSNSSYVQPSQPALAATTAFAQPRMRTTQPSVHPHAQHPHSTNDAGQHAGAHDSYFQHSTSSMPPFPSMITPPLQASQYVLPPPPGVASAPIPHPAAHLARKSSAPLAKKTKEAKPLPLWVPGNYSTSKAFAVSSNSRTSAKPVSPSPQRARGRGGNVNNSEDRTATLRPSSRSSSAPPVSAYSHYPDEQRYSNGMPSHPYGAPIMQSQQSQQNASNHFQSKMHHSAHPPQANSMDNITIGQLREALLSIPNHIRSSLIGDVSESRERTQQRDHSSASWEDSQRGHFLEKSQNDNGFMHHEEEQAYEAEGGNSDFNAGLFVDEVSPQANDYYQYHHSSQRSGDFEQDGEAKHLSPLDERRPGMGARQASSRSNFVAHGTPNRSQPLQRSKSTPPSISNGQLAKAPPNKPTIVSAPPRSREALLDWSKKQAQTKYLSKESLSASARLKERTGRPQTGMVSSSREPSSELPRSKSAARNSQPPSAADRGMQRSSSVPRAKSLGGAQSFFEFKKSMSLRGKTDDELAKEHHVQQRDSQPPAQSGGSSVLLNSDFVRKNQAVLLNYRGVAQQQRPVGEQPSHNTVAPVQSNGVLSSYEALKVRTGLMKPGPRPAIAESQNPVQPPVRRPTAPATEPRTPLRQSLQRQDSKFSTAGNNDSMTDLAEWQRFTQWLESIGMDHYISEMHEHGVTKLSIIELLTEDDLVQIGVAGEDIPIILRKVSDLTQRIRSFSDAFSMHPHEDKLMLGMGGSSPPHGRAAVIDVNYKTVRRELLKHLDNGELDKFFALWNAFASTLEGRISEERQALDFHLYLHFCVLAMKTNMSMGKILHAKEALRQYLDSTQSNIYTTSYSETDGQNQDVEEYDLKASMQRMTSSQEFATFAGLVFVPYPQMNPAFQSLFSDEWEATLRKRLEALVDAMLTQQQQQPPKQPHSESNAHVLAAGELADLSKNLSAEFILDSPGIVEGATHQAAELNRSMHTRNVGPEDLTDEPSSVRVQLVKPAVQRVSAPSARVNPVLAIRSLVDMTPSLSTDQDGVILSPMANHVSRDDCQTPTSVGSSISQLTDDTPLKVAAKESQGTLVAATGLPPTHFASPLAPSQNVLSDAANRAATKLKVLGQGPASPNRSALQTQVDNYNRMLKQNRVVPPTVPALVAPPPSSTVPGPVPISLSRRVESTSARGAEVVKPMHKFNLGVSSRAVDLSQVNKYKAILQAKQSASAAIGTPEHAFRSVSGVLFPAAPALDALALSHHEPLPESPAPPPPTIREQPEASRQRRPSELHNPDITANTLERYLDDGHESPMLPSDLAELVRVVVEEGTDFTDGSVSDVISPERQMEPATPVVAMGAIFPGNDLQDTLVQIDGTQEQRVERPSPSAAMSALVEEQSRQTTSATTLEATEALPVLVDDPAATLFNPERPLVEAGRAEETIVSTLEKPLETEEVEGSITLADPSAPQVEVEIPVEPATVADEVLVTVDDEENAPYEDAEDAAEEKQVETPGAKKKMSKSAKKKHKKQAAASAAAAAALSQQM